MRARRKKDLQRPFSLALALRVVSLFCAFSHARGHLRVLRILLDVTRIKRDC